MSDSVWPHRRQPTRLPHPWDSPGKSIGMGCHFLLQRRKVKTESEVAQSCPALNDPVDCSPPGASVHGILQARGREGEPWPSPSPAHSVSQPGLLATQCSMIVSVVTGAVRSVKSSVHLLKCCLNLVSVFLQWYRFCVKRYVVIGKCWKVY